MPTVLFDVGLGSIYEYPPPGANENAVGTFPVKRLVSEQLGDGDGYDWALNLCKLIEGNLGIAPEITDIVESDTYRCGFSSGEEAWRKRRAERK